MPEDSPTFWDMRAKLTVPPRRPAAPEPTSQTKPAEPWSVSEYAGHVKTALRRHLPEAISVRGEVADWNVNRRSGHHYFSLKDQNAKLDGIVYGSRARGLDFVPTTGDEVVVDGSASFYAPFGKLSLIGESVRPSGAGALEAAFQRLKAKLLAEGLFNDERKRPVPPYPTRIAIVTSAGAAGYQDVRKVFRAYPHLTLMLYNVAVQGDAAAREVAAAMSHLGQRHGDVGGVDVVLLVRGGGSREDLWAFNEEAVARAVADCPLPVVTGLGHETDTHLADLAADLHAHTPTQAAQLVAASWRNAADRVDQLAIVLRRGMRDAYRDARDDLRQISRHEVFRRPLDLVERRRQGLDLVSGVLDRRWLESRRSHDGLLRDLGERLALAAPARRLRRQADQLESLRLRLAREADAALRRARAEARQADGRLRLASPARRIGDRAGDLRRAADRLERSAPAQALADRREDVGRVRAMLDHIVRRRLDGARHDASAASRQLGALDPSAVLARGYTITRTDDGRVVRSAADVSGGDRLVTRTADGSLRSTVDA